jgi:hypothetical protein
LLALDKPLPGDKHWPDRTKLRQIISGKVKSVDVDWWRWENGVTKHQVDVKAERDHDKRLAALKAMADPARNSNAHERRAAKAALARAEAAGPPSGRLSSAPGLEEFDREQARQRAFYQAQYDEIIKTVRERKAREAVSVEPKYATKHVNTTTVEPKYVKPGLMLTPPVNLRPPPRPPSLSRPASRAQPTGTASPIAIGTPPATCATTCDDGERRASNHAVTFLSDAACGPSACREKLL